jgi:iron complex outermembrane receptor protein
MKAFLLGFLCYGSLVVAAGAQPVADSLPAVVRLDSVTITAVAPATRSRQQPLAVVSAEGGYIMENRSNSLMTSLTKLPGVNAMPIGQGFSKPVIRGLGFNRVAVVENGIKQQGQQWGADHGLEIDRYNVEYIEIVKGPASLQYGADAMAGAVVLRPRRLTPDEGLSGAVLLTGNSNNRLAGGSAALHYQHAGRYIRGRATYQNFEDYRVPAESFDYLNYTFPIYKGILKNTAGRETDVALQAGVVGNRTSSALSVSNVHARTGFFAGAHGLPTTVALADDNDYRNIGLPYQAVNHLKAVANQTLRWGSHQATVDAGYQYNLRQEYSQPHTHGYGPVPEGDKELELRLQTASLHVVWEYAPTSAHRLQAGVNTEYQHHRIGGYSFLLPAFEQWSGGVFVMGQVPLSGRLSASAGVRYDRSRVHIHRYIDPSLPEAYRQRSPEMTKHDGDLSFNAGLTFVPHPLWEVKANVGKSFRMPTVSEYSSNGVHHGMFRHELGDSTLTHESSYQADVSFTFRTTPAAGAVQRIALEAALFANYFPRFIFLNPTGHFSWLPDAGQYYRYQQSEAFRAGGEIRLTVDFARLVRWEGSAEYVHATDLDSGYPIPFTPPLSLVNEWSVGCKRWWFLSSGRAAFTCRYAAAQRRTTRNEKATPPYHLFDASLSAGFPLGGRAREWRVVVQVHNLFDTKYYNHLSFYRYLNLPESGRNFLLSVQIPI